MTVETAKGIILKADSEGQEFRCQYGHATCSPTVEGECVDEAIARLMGSPEGEAFLQSVGFDVEYWRGSQDAARAV